MKSPLDEKLIDYEDAEEFLQHYGVLGMKWGVRKDRKALSQNGSKKDKPKKKPGRIKQEYRSFKRENSWKKTAAEINKMTTKEVLTMANRANLENEFKKLSGQHDVIGRGTEGNRKVNKAEKYEYRRRAEMSDQEIQRKTKRLRAVAALKRASDTATATQKAMGDKVMEAVSGQVLSAAGVPPNDYITELIKNQ